MQDYKELTDKEKEYYHLSSTHFNLQFNRSKRYKCIYDELSVLVKHSRDISKELWCLITNTARALSYGAMTLSIPRDKKPYLGNTQKISCARMKIVLDSLEEQGFLIGIRGCLDGDTKVVSMYHFSEKYKLLWKCVDTSNEVEYHPSVLIKDRETKEYKSCQGVAGVGDIKKKVDAYNGVLSTVHLTKDGVPLPKQFYFRSFLDNLEKGGRYYNSCGGIQTLPQKERNKLTINKERVVELDFKAMHPSILYDWEWQKDSAFVEQWIDKFFGGVYDPYKVDVSEFIKVDLQKAEEYRKFHELGKYDPVRNLIKYAVMVGINAANHQAACSAVTKELYSEKDVCVEDEDLSFYGIIIPPNNKGLISFQSSFFCNACRLTNGPIERYFFADKGVDLQLVDSEIMTQVINTLTLDGEAAFSEHDSIIVRESVSERAEYLMRTAYESVVGSSRFCVIERK